MIYDLIFLVLGFALLVKGADLFVDGACDLSAKLRIPAYIVGMTVVACGTSLPEAAVSITAAMSGSNEIAIGNVIGSNTFNTLVVLGASALFAPVAVKKDILKFDFPFCIFITVLLFILLITLNGGNYALTLIDAIILLAFFAVFMTVSVISGKKGIAEGEEAGNAETPLWKIIVFILLGIAAVIAGGQATVEGATGIAKTIGLSETVIGLTVVAIGTSLPELVTSVVAARKKQNDIAVGNVIGSNIFNILFILGVSALITDIGTDSYVIADAVILIGIMAFTYIISLAKKEIRKPVGIFMILMYVAYTAFLLIR